MRQYFRFKRQHPDCTLLFRIGDFYEMFDDDAVKVSKAIGLTLTQRTEGMPMAGVPYHQLETYLRKLLAAGFRVAVCEQTQPPQDAAEVKSGSIMERAVTRVLTPGTLVDESLLDGDAPSTLAAVCFTGEGDHSPAVAAVVDLSTGRFEVFESPGETLGDELTRRRVSELVYAQTADGKEPPRVKAVLAVLGIGGAGTPQPSWFFRMDEAREALLKQYGVATLEGFGFGPEDPAIRAAGAVVRYLQLTQLPSSDHPTSDIPHPTSRSLSHLQPPRRDEPGQFCILDGTTLRSLEVLRTIRAAPGGGGEDSDGSLLGIFASSRTFPGCRTAMGKRLLREWLCRPLRDIEAIEARQKCVATLIEDRQTGAALSAAMDNVQDIARIAGRLALGRANPRDVVALGRSLAQVTPVGEALANAPAFAAPKARIDALSAKLRPLAERIADRCVESPPPHLRDGGLFKDGFDPELDEARRLGQDAAGWMADYQARLITEHQLPSLKVGYNKIFGYYIELPSAQSKRAPDAFTRKQTLKNAERYITPELKDFESRAGTAESRALAREQSLFEDLCDRARGLIPQITAFADAVAELDVLACFAEKAVRRRWVRPEIVDRPVLGLEQARHPVLDERLERNFVPNDLWLGAGAAGRLAPWQGSEKCQGGEVSRCQVENDSSLDTSTPAHLDTSTSASLALITGPNMAGKSTFIRTAALLTLLAHTGSFVPSDKAVIGITDRIFTRIGADDALHAGQSTFMVEMTETARILNHATERSLVILDEIGRGTSTLDGLSLAWAIAETLAGQVSRCQGVEVPRGAKPSTPRHLDTSSPRVLFATHYHELTDLEEMLPGRVVNLHVSVREWGEEIVFLHRILPGRTDRSYGVHVAKLAGLPSATVARAKEILETLAVQHHGPTGGAGAGGTASKGAREPGSKGAKSAVPPTSGGQLALFTEYVAHPAVDELREVKLDALTPLQAFDVLRKLKGMTEAKEHMAHSPRQMNSPEP